MKIFHKIKEFDLVSIIEGEGIKLVKQGNNHLGLCPFHQDGQPSFYIFEDGHYHCFGCSDHGDALDFIQKLRGLNFVDALNYLGLRKEQPSEEYAAKIRKLRLERQKTEAEKKRIAELQDTLFMLIRATKEAAKGIKTK